MRVSLTVPDKSPYPYEAIRYGLETIGVDLCPANPDQSDFLITWSPWVGSVRASRVDQFGSSRSIIMENGFLSPIENKKYYQVGLGGWNAHADFPQSDQPRFNIRSEIIKERDGPLLLIGQSGHLKDRRTAPRNWAEKTYFDLKNDGHNVLIRRKGENRPLEADLDNAGAVYTWSSNAACWAILRGIPVYRASDTFIMHQVSAYYDNRDPIPTPFVGDPSSVIANLSWLQWNEEELSTGVPFQRIFDYAHSSSIQT